MIKQYKNKFYGYNNCFFMIENLKIQNNLIKNIDFIIIKNKN